MWHEFLERNTFICNLYTEVPQLNNVRIAQIDIRDEGRVVSVSFDMPCFADKPPKKWLELGDNTVHVKVDFSAVQEITLTSSGSRDFRGNIEINKDDLDFIVLKVTGTVNAFVKSESAFIQSVTGHIKV